MTGRLAAVAWLALGAGAPALALDATDVKPLPGLVITNTVFASVVAGGKGFGYMDTEDHFTLLTSGADGLGYQIRMSAPGNEKVEELARRLKWPRHVRHEDLEESSRMTLLYSSNDPENYGGQTFATDTLFVGVIIIAFSGIVVSLMVGSPTVLPTPVISSHRRSEKRGQYSGACALTSDA